MPSRPNSQVCPGGHVLGSFGSHRMPPSGPGGWPLLHTVLRPSIRLPLTTHIRPAEQDAGTLMSHGPPSPEGSRQLHRSTSSTSGQMHPIEVWQLSCPGSHGSPSEPSEQTK